jgi:hypothetical protein
MPRWQVDKHGVQVSRVRFTQRAGSGNDGKYMPALPMAACATCQLARLAATERGSFLTIFLEVVFFDNSLTDVVFFVKNSSRLQLLLLSVKWPSDEAH